MPPTPIKKDVVYINYCDIIDMDRVRALMGAITQILGQFKPDTIYMMFATPGGQVDAGIALYNFLKAIPPKIVMHNMSAVNSIGNVIFLAGEERYASPNTTFLFHGVELQIQNPVSLGLSKLKEIESSLSEDQNKIAGIIASHTSFTDAEVRELFATGASKSANHALDKNVISEIREVRLKPDDLLVNIGSNSKR